MEKWSPTAEYLSNQIPGSTFTIVPLKIDEIHPVVHNGEVDFVITNPYYYVELEVFYGVNRIATPKNILSDKVSTVYGGVIFCRKDREDIKQLSDLKGKSCMAPNEKVLIGWVEVLRVFREHDIDPLGPYEDFGKLSLTDVFKQYRYWFITALIFLMEELKEPAKV